MAFQREVGLGEAKARLLLVGRVIFLGQRLVGGDCLLVPAVALELLGVGQVALRLCRDDGVLRRRGRGRGRGVAAATGRQRNGQSDDQETYGGLGGRSVLVVHASSGSTFGRCTTAS